MDRHLLVELLHEELSFEKRQLSYFDSRMPRLPEGSLLIKGEEEQRLYYRQLGQKAARMVISIPTFDERNRKLIAALLERRVIYHARPKLRKSIGALERVLTDLYTLDPQTIVGEEELPDTLFLPAQLNVRKWLQDTEAGNYNTNPFYPQTLRFEIKGGYQVRSKSEVFISEALDEVGFAYRYECELRLNNGRVIYPDFTVCLPEENRLVYIEHFGLMDDPEYAMKALVRLQEYADSGIILGRDLFYTMETKARPFTIANARDLAYRIRRS